MSGVVRKWCGTEAWHGATCRSMHQVPPHLAPSPALPPGTASAAPAASSPSLWSARCTATGTPGSSGEGDGDWRGGAGSGSGSGGKTCCWRQRRRRNHHRYVQSSALHCSPVTSVTVPDSCTRSLQLQGAGTDGAAPRGGVHRWVAWRHLQGLPLWPPARSAEPAWRCACDFAGIEVCL